MESMPFIPTKLIPPIEGGNIIKRPALLQILETTVDYPITLVSASAGFGKSLLISQWVQSCGMPWTWLTLDVLDNSVAGFFTYFIRALQKIVPSLGEDILRSLELPQLPSAETIMMGLIHQLFDIPRKTILVLDDYHQVDSGEIHQAMHFLLLNLPPSLKILLITRENPSIPFASFRAKNQICEIGNCDLRFSLEETEQFIKQATGYDLSQEDLLLLNEKVEGWGTGLQMASISMGQRKDLPSFFRSFSGTNSYITDYLMEEVFSSLPRDIQLFLLQTSLFDRWCLDLLRFINPPENPASLVESLEDLKRMNLFLVSLDEEDWWYRFHNPFKEFLNQKIQHSTLNISEIHSRASQWFDRNDLPLETFLHLSASGDLDKTIEWINWNTRLATSPQMGGTIYAWLKALPEETTRTRPELLVIGATYALTNGQVSNVEEMIFQAERLIGDSNPHHPLWGQISISRSTLALAQYNYSEVLSQSTLALQRIPQTFLSLRCPATWMIGMAHLDCKELREAKDFFEEAKKESRLGDNPFIDILSTIGLGQVEERSSHLFKASEYYKNALELAGTLDHPTLGEAYLGLARIHYHWNQLEKSAEWTQRALQSSSQFEGPIDRSVLAELHLVRLKRIAGDLDQAGILLDEIEKTVRSKGFDRRIRDVAKERTLLYIARDKLLDAQFLAKKNHLKKLELRILLIEQKGTEALQLISELYKPSESFQKGHIEEQLLFVSAYFSLHNCLPRNYKIKEFLNLAREEGFVRIFLDLGEPAYKWLQKVCQEDGALEYGRTLLNAFDHENYIPRETPDEVSTMQHLVEPLSKRELDVLNLVAQGYSNQEICDTLFLALDTVKGHNRRIFQKLYVDNRIQAVNAARKLKIIT